MADESKSEIWRQHRVGQDKYTYFLLAAASAGIAFSVQKTDELALSWNLAPVGLAVLAWGLSFYCGCKNILWVQTALYANFSLLQLMDGTHPEQPEHPSIAAAAMAGVRSAVDKNIKRAKFHDRWQFRLLILGAVLFLAWHVCGLYVRAAA